MARTGGVGVREGGVWRGGGGRTGGGGSGSGGGEGTGGGGSGAMTVGVITGVMVWTGGVASGTAPFFAGRS